MNRKQFNNFVAWRRRKIIAWYRYLLEKIEFVLMHVTKKHMCANIKFLVKDMSGSSSSLTYRNFPNKIYAYLNLRLHLVLSLKMVENWTASNTDSITARYLNRIVFRKDRRNGKTVERMSKKNRKPFFILCSSF